MNQIRMRNIFLTIFLLAIKLVQGDDQQITLIEKIYVSDNNDISLFGQSVSMYDNYLVSGSETCDVNEYSDAGCVYIYEYNTNTNKWDELQILISNELTIDEEFGDAIKIYKNNIIIGCDGSQKVFIFEKNDTSIQNGLWYYKDTLLPFSDGSSDNFGQSVDIKNNYAIVGDYQNTDKASDGGAVYIYIKNVSEDNWIGMQILYEVQAFEDDFFGIDVAICSEYSFLG